MKSAAEFYNKNDNFFTTIRFIFAVVVIYSHSPMLLSKSKDILAVLTDNSLGSVSVKGFFVISGFLVIQSLFRSKIKIFFLKRFLRIVPALFVTLFITAFIMGPFLSDLKLHDYFSFTSVKGSPYTFFINYLSFDLTGSSYNTYFIRDLFNSNPSYTVNGSLWSLKFEFIMYLVLPLLFFLFKKNTAGLIMMYVVFLLGELMQTHTGKFIGKIGYSYYYFLIVQCGYYFFSGVVFYLFKEKILISTRSLSICILLLIVSIKFCLFKYALILFLPYLILGTGILIKKDPIVKYGDYSYGLYIYAYPIQQILISIYNEHLTNLILFLGSFLLTFFVAIISWHFIEKPFISIGKNKAFKSLATSFF